MEYKSETIELAQGLCECATSADAFLSKGDDIITLALAIADQKIKGRDVISSWTALNIYLRLKTAGKGTEEFRVLLLDKRNQLIADVLMNTGTIDHCPVYPREVVKLALLHDAASIILTHNHPSGDPTPSSPDIDMTRQVIDACKSVRVAVHDHVITGAGQTTSFRALGLM